MPKKMEVDNKKLVKMVKTDVPEAKFDNCLYFI